MDTKASFSKKFRELMASGGHLVASLVDAEGELQVSEIYGAELKEGGDLTINLFFSENVAPDFYRALASKKKAAIVICSPFNMEAYQVKGVIDEISILSEDNQAQADYWRENYLLCLKSIGVPQNAISHIAYRPTHCFGLIVNQIFMQTPEMGTGGEL